MDSNENALVHTSTFVHIDIPQDVEGRINKYFDDMPLNTIKKQIEESVKEEDQEYQKKLIEARKEMKWYNKLLYVLNSKWGNFIEPEKDESEKTKLLKAQLDLGEQAKSLYKSIKNMPKTYNNLLKRYEFYHKKLEFGLNEEYWAAEKLRKSSELEIKTIAQFVRTLENLEKLPETEQGGLIAHFKQKYPETSLDLSSADDRRYLIVDLGNQKFKHQGMVSECITKIQIIDQNYDHYTKAIAQIRKSLQNLQDAALPARDSLYSILSDYESMELNREANIILLNIDAEKIFGLRERSKKAKEEVQEKINENISRLEAYKESYEELNKDNPIFNTADAAKSNLTPPDYGKDMSDQVLEKIKMYKECKNE